jgi:hypothetical protein
VRGRARLDVKLSLDGGLVASETTYVWAGPYVLSVHSVIPQPDLAVELHSTFCGHPGTPTAVSHVTLGAAGAPAASDMRRAKRAWISWLATGACTSTRCGSLTYSAAWDANRAWTGRRPSVVGKVHRS